MNVITKLYVRAAGKNIWHKVVQTKDAHVVAVCGAKLRPSDTKGTRQPYDKKSTWPPRFAKWCFDCQKSPELLRRSM